MAARLTTIQVSIRRFQVRPLGGSSKLLRPSNKEEFFLNFFSRFFVLVETWELLGDDPWRAWLRDELDVQP